MDKIQLALRMNPELLPVGSVVVEAKCTPTQIVLPKSYTQWKSTEKLNKNLLKNLTHEEFRLSKLSANSKRKLERKLDWLLALTARHTGNVADRDYVLRNNCAVITLTLSDLQYHSDKYIKRQMLNIFLTELRKEYLNVSYIWKAEAQESGNIHFHIIVNQFVCHEWVREKWNKIQNDNGYIKKYNHENDKKKYPSTEAKGCQNVHDVRSYLLKYVSKTDCGREIEGRLWSCSHDLTGFNVLDLELSREQYISLEKAVTDKKVTKHEFDYAVMYKGDFRLLEKTHYDITRKKIRDMLFPFYDFLHGGFKLDLSTGELSPRKGEKNKYADAGDFTQTLTERVVQLSIDDFFDMYACEDDMSAT